MKIVEAYLVRRVRVNTTKNIELLNDIIMSE